MTGLLAHLLIQPCTITNPASTTTDDYGNAVSVPGAPVGTTGYLYQQATTEYLMDRDTIISVWYCDLFAEVTITAQATIQFNSQVFQVDGAPQSVWNPRLGVVDHIECKLVVVQG